MNPVVKRLKDLRELMEQRGIDIYVVPTSDFHESEYVGEYFKARKFITGFTGSAGTAVITKTQAGLWTDGRYFVQAKNQLKDSTVTLFPMGEENVPTVAEFVKENLPPKGCIGFDGRVVNGKAGEEYKNIADEKKGRLYVEEDLVDLIWEERPPMSKKPFFILEEKYSGKSTKEKLQEVRGEMEKEKADIHILTSLYDIAWLLNVRGGDIDYVPVVLSYLVLSKEECVWFLQQEILTEEQKSYLKDNGIVTKEYEEIYSYVPEIPGDKKALLHKSEVNYRIVNALKDTVEIIDKENPTELMKSVKNKTEAENTIKAHVKDGVAFTKFMYWLKNSIGKEEITEISASDVLENFRRQQENFLDLSFDTISAYGANAAMMHYSATEETNALLKPEGFLLVDSGGHYLEGTTDITRTMALGPITEEMRLHFTTVLCSNLNLASARFLHGCTGRNLDILSRGPLWKLGIDYKCGTGHGVGHILNVHEGPNSFRWQKREGVPEAVLEEGMITTDEPGVYIEGAYGIRTENELLCKKGVKNEYGQFMEFETITYAPIDLDAIDPNLMTEEQRAVLNEYHKKVYEVLSPYMTQEENKWLKEYTRAV
ncbi:aminopeptidase P family protein [Roseburia sp. 1XD42-69]|uniref:aminopeptidase P family protein n=1 Tax=Roseburia sp. 1XD42-69 TaxID=2320088 RepID=UPI000EA15C0C|nr:aminopeptidase P family protein [Roseburia sp. 1XD42-69]RKJ67397.1 aminopeptidase P family protein [Roseburia sp. 1XD42-69]